jgi:hypothetical protein
MQKFKPEDGRLASSAGSRGSVDGGRGASAAGLYDEEGRLNYVGRARIDDSAEIQRLSS